jgi:hypothetical protein
MAHSSTHPRRTLLLRLFVGLVLLGLLILASALLFWQQFKRDQGIRQIDWHGLQLRAGHLYIQQLTLEREDAGSLLVLQADALLLDWQLLGGARLESLTSKRLAVRWQPGDATDDSDAQPLQLSRPDPRELLPAWLPHRLRIEQLQVELPCAAGHCSLSGSLAMQYSGSSNGPTAIRLSLLHDARQLDLDAEVSGPVDQVDLWVRAQIDGNPRLSLTSVYQAGAETATWSGQLELPALPEAAWLVAWLEQWSGPQPNLQQTGELQLQADWDWQLAPGPLHAEQLRNLNGHINLQAELPTHWPLPGIGLLQGTAALQLLAEDGRWSARQLQADLNLEQLDPDRLARLPDGLRPSALHLQVQQPETTEQPGNELPLRLQLTGSGALRLDLQGDVRLTPSRAWALQLDNTRLQAQSARLQLPALDARNLKLDLKLAGLLDAETFALQLEQASSLTVGELLIPNENDPVRAKGLQLDRAALAIGGNLNGESISYEVRGPARLRLTQLQHSLVKPLDWSWEGELQVDQDQQQLSGKLANSAELAGSLQLERNADTLQITAKLPESFLRGGNPLAATLADWPELLELGNGRLQLDAMLGLPAKGPLQAQADVRLKGVAGLYDRTEFSGLDSRLQARLNGEQLQVSISELNLKQANPGFVLGPLQFAGHYQARLDQLGSGRLDWSQARSGLFGGEVRLEPGNLRLDQPQVLPVHLRGLLLQELFSAYPAEGLSGEGTLDGELPVGFGPEGIRIVDGQLAARQPGQLQFTSEKISALGRSNPAMQVVADALEDFHYELLSSGVDYDDKGKLRLGLKLEGRNPDVERGRPINFSINLEEDIPALLTSLQLSERVSEKVRERVQQHLEQSTATP